MYFDLSKPQQLLQQSVRDFCKREFPVERVRELMETDSAVDDQLWEAMAEQGWIGLHLEEEYEGLGLGPVELAIVAEELGRACVPGPWLSTNWAASLLAAVGGPAAVEFLPKVVDGSTQMTVAILEELGSWGSEAQTLETNVNAGDSVLNGRKDLVLHAEQAEAMLCQARQGDELCVVLVPVQTQGVSVTATPGIDATRKLYRCDFERVPIKPEQVLATGSSARSALESSQRVATVVVCAEMLGVMQWILEATVEYAQTLKQFDRPIGSFQAIQHKCADILMLAESSRSAVWYAAWTLQENTPDAAQAVAIAKIYVSDAVRQVGNLAVQTHGGIGFTWEHDLHLYYRRAKSDEYLLGDASFHREQMAELIFGGQEFVFGVIACCYPRTQFLR